MSDMKKASLDLKLLKTRNRQEYDDSPMVIFLRYGQFDNTIAEKVTKSGQEFIRESEKNFKDTMYEETEEILKESCNKVKDILTDVKSCRIFPDASKILKDDD